MSDLENVEQDVVSPAPATPDLGDSSDSSFDTDNSTERKSVREELKDGFERARQRMGLEDETAAPAEKKAPAKQRRTRETLNAQDTNAADSKASEQPAGSQSAGPPAAWAKDAKGVWSTVPAAAQAAIIKREQDVEKGVIALRDHYKGIDGVLGQYQNEIRDIGLPAPQVLNNLFGWMKAVHGNPVEAVPALMAAYNFSPQAVAGVIQKLASWFPKKPKSGQAQGQAQDQGQGAEQGQAAQTAQVPPELINYIQQQQARINQLEQYTQQELGGVKGVFQRQYEAQQQHQQAQTDSYLDDWAKDKPFFNEVRQFMAKLLMPDAQTGQATIPLKDGRVDLEAAYDYAIHAFPQIRQKVLATQQQAAQQARQNKFKTEASAQNRAAFEAARKKVSVSSTAPGATPSTKPKRGMSVQDTLRAAIEEVNGRT
jgi:hypothetical protein